MTLGHIADHPTFTLIQSLTERAEGRRRFANRLLWLIVVMILTGCVFYSYAPLLLDFDRQIRERRITSITEQISAQQKILDRFNERKRGLVTELARRGIPGVTQANAEDSILALLQLLKRIDPATQSPAIFGAAEDREEAIRRNTDRMKGEIVAAVAQLEGLAADQERVAGSVASLSKELDIARQATATGKDIFTTTTITRAGVIILLVFLVTIFSSLYRYNMRLAAFYHSRADMFIAAGEWEHQHNLRDLADILGPERIEFARTNTPIDTVKDITTEIIRKVGPTRST